MTPGARAARHSPAGPRLRRPCGDVIAGSLVVMLVAGPALFTHDGFGRDFTNHLWLVYVQAHAISQHLAPTYFLDAPRVGVFYPYFIFYGGTLYALFGGLAALLGGQAVVAYVASVVLGIGAAYGGLVWLARLAGLRSWPAHIPALVFVTSAYYVTNLYGRGDWPEFMATSMIPLALASGWQLLTAAEVRFPPAALFVLSVVIFAGSHGVSMLLGTLIVVPALALLWAGCGRPRRALARRRVLQVGGLMVLAVAVDAWILVPEILYSFRTQISRAPLYSWSRTGFLDSPGVLFDPFREVPTGSTTPALYVQIPDWFLVWSMAAIGLLWNRGATALRGAAVSLYVILGALLVVVMVGPLWDALPPLVRQVQFPYRLGSYVALCVAALALVAALFVEHGGATRSVDWLRTALAGAAGVSTVLCAWQLWVPNTHVPGPGSYENRNGALVSAHATPSSWYSQRDLADASARVVATTRSVRIAPARVGGNRVAVWIDPPPARAPFATNISGGPYVVAVRGAVVRVGRTAGGLTVLRRARADRGRTFVTIEAAGRGLAIGRDLSLAALAGLLLLAARSLLLGPRGRRTAIAADQPLAAAGWPAPPENRRSEPPG